MRPASQTSERPEAASPRSPPKSGEWPDSRNCRDPDRFLAWHLDGTRIGSTGEVQPTRPGQRSSNGMTPRRRLSGKGGRPGSVNGATGPRAFLRRSSVPQRRGGQLVLSSLDFFGRRVARVDPLGRSGTGRANRTHPRATKTGQVHLPATNEEASVAATPKRPKFSFLLPNHQEAGWPSIVRYSTWM